MMLNRRDFLKKGLGGLFGAFLTWAGVVKAEEPETIHLTFTEEQIAWQYGNEWNLPDGEGLPFVRLEDDLVYQVEQDLIAELSEATKVKIAIDFKASWNNPETIYMARAVFYSDLVGKECVAFCDFTDELLHSVEVPLLTDIIATQLRQVFRDGELERLENAHPA